MSESAKPMESGEHEESERAARGRRFLEEAAKCDGGTHGAAGALLEQIDALRAEVEEERMRVAACDAVALADTPESAKKAREMKPEYRSAALESVERRVDECIALRAEVEEARGLLLDLHDDVLLCAIHEDEPDNHAKAAREAFARIDAFLGAPEWEKGWHMGIDLATTPDREGCTCEFMPPGKKCAGCLRAEMRAAGPKGEKVTPAPSFRDWPEWKALEGAVEAETAAEADAHLPIEDRYDREASVLDAARALVKRAKDA